MSSLTIRRPDGGAPSDRRRRATRWSVAGGGAIVGFAFMGLMSGPFAHAGYTTDASDWLYYIWPGVSNPDGGVTADTALVNFDNNLIDQFSTVYADEIQMYQDLAQDVFAVGNLIEGAVGDVGSMMTGIGAVAHPAAALAVTVANLVDVAEGNAQFLANQTLALQNGPFSLVEDFHLVGYDMSQFEQAVHNALANLNVTSADAGNAALLYDLEQVVGAQDQQYTYLNLLTSDLANNAGPTDVISNESWIYELDNSIYNYMQGALSGVAWDHLF